MKGMGTDHVISGPIKDLIINCIQWRRQTVKQTDIATLRLNWPSAVGRFSEKQPLVPLLVVIKVVILDALYINRFCQLIPSSEVHTDKSTFQSRFKS